MAKTMKVGWIGLGKMGTPMAQNLIKAGFLLGVYNRTREKTRELEANGAAVADSIVTLAEESDVVVSMVSDDRILEAVTIGPGGAFEGMRLGSIFIDMSTVSPRMSEQISIIAIEKGIHYLRAPVSGGVSLAVEGILTIIASGPEQTYADCQDLFRAMGERIFYVGESEEARYLKLSLNIMVGITAGMLGEALAFGKKCGLDWEQMIDIIGCSAVASPLVGYKVEPLKQRDFTATFTTSMMAKDFDLVLDTARDIGAPMLFTAMMRQCWSMMEAAGKGEMDFFAYVTLAEDMTGSGFEDRSPYKIGKIHEFQ